LEQPSIFDGHLHAPFFIYFRREPLLSDKQILAHFGLHAYHSTAKLPPSSTYAVITDAGDWTLLADDWLYQLWHMPSTRNAIKLLAKTRDVFAWSIGDCDQSFEYTIYRNGELVRQYIVDSPHFDDQVVRIDFGDRLPFESELHDLPIEQKMDRFCSDIGINTIVQRDGLRLYYKPYRSNLDLSAGIRNF
jgi:hypothetical protein